MPQVWVNGKIIEGPSAREILPSVLGAILLPRDGDLLPPISFAAVAGWDDWDAALAAGVFCLAAQRLEAKALIALPEPIREKFVQQGLPPEIAVGVGEELANLMLERWSAPKTTAHRTRLVIFGSSKGGLGKTSLALLASGHEMAHGRFAAVVDMDPNGSMGIVARQRAEEDSHFHRSGLAYIHSPPNFLAPRLFFARASWEAGSDEGAHLALAMSMRPDTVVVDMSGDLEASKRGLERVRFWAGMADAQLSGVQAVVLVSPQRDLMEQAVRAIEMYGSALISMAEEGICKGPAELLVVFPYSAHGSDVEAAGRVLANDLRVQALQRKLAILIAADPIPPIGGQWEYWKRLFDLTIPRGRLDPASGLVKRPLADLVKAKPLEAVKGPSGARR
ncbi:hypothetical protein [Thermoflexus sp.]|jgi:hypothetical protein|uniref:hypothetical protein n=1 Tax=Thermoflexus sp. TaxID=1969742 RepID=UPI003C11938B